MIFVFLVICRIKFGLWKLIIQSRCGNRRTSDFLPFLKKVNKKYDFFSISINKLIENDNFFLGNRWISDWILKAHYSLFYELADNKKFSYQVIGYNRF
jgi:hypothetical protein